MADDWFKLNMDIFSNRKIKYIRRLPNGDSMALFWIALLAEARRCNADGKVFLTENMPYTADMLAEDFDFEESTVKCALETFKQLDMTYTSNGFITIAGWEDHQNAEGLAKIREQNRIRQAKYKAKQKTQTDNVSGNVTVTLGNATEEDKEEEKEREIDKKEEKIDYQQIADMYNSICTSFPSIRSLSDARKKAIKARLNTYTVEDFRTVFENAEASSFLKGSNDRNWTATFDWLIKDSNMAKVLEGNYADKGQKYKRKEPVPGWYKPFEAGDSEMAAMKQQMDSVENNPELAERVEEMQRMLQEKYGKRGVTA